MSTRHNPDEAYIISLSNQTILILCTIGFASLGIAFYFLILRHVPSSTTDGDEPVQNYDEFLDHSDVATLNRAERRARAKLHMKKARRAAVPAAGRRDADGGDGNDAVLDELDRPVEVDDAGSGLSRKERQRVAKALEREERKISAEIARTRREKGQKKTQKQQTNRENDVDDDAGRPLSLDEIFPRRQSSTNDPLKDYLFHESLTRKYTNSPQQFLDESMLLKIITTHTFINNLQTTGYVRIKSLTDDFGLTHEEVHNELNQLNSAYGIIGVFDNGSFVYVSKEMIEMAVESGKKMGTIHCPVEQLTVKS